MTQRDDNTTRSPLRIFITGSCDGLDKLRDALAAHDGVELVGAAEQVREAAGPLAGGHLQGVLHATRASQLPQDDLAAIREYTQAPIVLLVSGDASSLLDAALDADVADVVPLPQLPDNVVFALRKAARPGRRGASDGRRRGKIVTIFSPKGGTGKTVTATNLAASLAKHERKDTLLLDLDLQFGDAAIMLGLEPEKTIHDLVVAPGELDSEKLAGYVAKHDSGLDILPAPLRPEEAELVTEGKLGRLLDVARESYDVIVVDTSPFFHGPMLATLDRTDQLLVLCALDVPTVKNVRLSLETLELLSYPTERVRLVLRDAVGEVGMKRREVEDALRVKVGFEVPTDRAVPLAVNRGKPVAIAETGAPFARAIRNVGKQLLATPHSKGGKRRLLPSLSRS
jgi:pilus assembly protein CpaE